MAFYCELPNERICDIGWERLTCTLKVRPARGGEPVIQLPRILLSTVKANQMIYFGPITVTVPAGKEGAE